MINRFSVKKTLLDFFKPVLELWSRFWFEPVPLLNLAVFRIILCFNFFFMYLSRQKDVSLFYTDQGILPKSLAFRALPEFYRPPVMLSFWPDSWVSAMHALLLLGLLLWGLGIGGRVIGWLCVFLHLAFLERNYGIAFGADQIGGIFMLYLAATKSCDRLSILNWKQKKLKEDWSHGFLTPVFYRMIQVQLGVIYAYTGFEKLKGATWWDGTALWSVFANSQMVIADLTWMKNLPMVIALISFSTVFFEIYFFPFVIFKATRKYVLTVGFFFHMGIGVIMALYSFAIMMLAPYVLFLSPQSLDLRRFLKKG